MNTPLWANRRRRTRTATPHPKCGVLPITPRPRFKQDGQYKLTAFTNTQFYYIELLNRLKAWFPIEPLPYGDSQAI